MQYQNHCYCIWSSFRSLFNWDLNPSDKQDVFAKALIKNGAEPELTLHAGWKAATQPGTDENGGNGGSSSANANANNTVNNNSHNKGKKPAKNSRVSPSVAARKN